MFVATPTRCSPSNNVRECSICAPFSDHHSLHNPSMPGALSNLPACAATAKKQKTTSLVDAASLQRMAKNNRQARTLASVWFRFTRTSVRFMNMHNSFGHVVREHLAPHANSQLWLPICFNGLQTRKSTYNCGVLLGRGRTVKDGCELNP